MSITAPTTTDYHGQQGVALEDPGTLKGNIYGIGSCTAIFRAPVANWTSLPGLRSIHPIFRSMVAEEAELKLKGPFAYMELSYKGLFPNSMGGSDGLPDPVYELVRGLSDDPIDTHPDFESKIGGTPTNPLNGAIFYNPKQGAYTNGETPTSDDKGWVFSSFSIIYGGKKNKKAKVEAYLNASKMTWRKTSVERGGNVNSSKAGTIDTPPGGPPSLPDGSQWLNMGKTVSRQGGVYQITEEWMASGPAGWDPDIYS